MDVEPETPKVLYLADGKVRFIRTIGGRKLFRSDKYEEMRAQKYVLRDYCNEFSLNKHRALKSRLCPKFNTTGIYIHPFVQRRLERHPLDQVSTPEELLTDTQDVALLDPTASSRMTHEKLPSARSTFRKEHAQEEPGAIFPMTLPPIEPPPASTSLVATAPMPIAGIPI